jgi:hypothetical protein
VWVAQRQSLNDAFGAPTFVAEVSSDPVDLPSFASADGCRLYLTSNRLGSDDLFVADRGR